MWSPDSDRAGCRVPRAVPGAWCLVPMRRGMAMTKIAAAGLAAGLTLAACGGGADGPPAIEVDRSACAHCGMLISEPRFAAAYRSASDEARVFDDIGCLLNSISRGADLSRTRFWFHDMDTAEWIDGERAVFVRSAHVRTPMAGGYVAYGGKEAAERGAAEHQGRVIGGLGELLQHKPEGGES